MDLKQKISFMSVMYVSRFVNLAPVVEMLECTICQKNRYPADKYQENLLHYPLDRDLSSTWH